MKKAKKEIEPVKIFVKASKDKETKRTNRYSIVKNKHGIFGVVYFDKEKHADLADTVKVKIIL